LAPAFYRVSAPTPAFTSAFCAAGLTQTSFFPQVTALAHDDQRLPMFRQQALSVLDANESEEWHAAIARADAEGTSLIATPHHCAVGTKP
jgi:hypothetical protein